MKKRNTVISMLVILAMLLTCIPGMALAESEPVYKQLYFISSETDISSEGAVETTWGALSSSPDFAAAESSYVFTGYVGYITTEDNGFEDSTPVSLKVLKPGQMMISGEGEEMSVSAASESGYLVTLTVPLDGGAYTITGQGEGIEACKTETFILGGTEGDGGEGGDDSSLQILDGAKEYSINELMVNTSLAVGETYFYVRHEGELSYDITRDLKESTWTPVAEEDESKYITVEAEGEGYSKVTIGAAGKYHGHEDLEITFSCGEETPVSITVRMGIDIKFKDAAIDAVYDLVFIKEELLEFSQIKYNDPMEETAAGDYLKVYYDGLGTTSEGDGEEKVVGQNVPLVITLKPGYAVEQIKLGETTLAYQATANYYYALYDAQDNRANAMLYEELGVLCKGNGDDESTESIPAEYTLVWTFADIKDGSFDPLQDVKQHLPEGYRVELLASVWQYDIPVTDLTGGKAIEIVTNSDAINATSEVSLMQEGLSLVKDEVAASAANTAGLEKFYGSDMEIEKIYEMSADLSQSEYDVVDVIIPVDNAEDYDVVWFKDADTPVPMVTNVTADGEGLIMATGHFSQYALVKEKTPVIIYPSAPPKETVTNESGISSVPTTNADMTDAVIIKGNESSTVVDDKTAGKIVEKAAANKSESVVIDAAVKKDGASHSVKSAEVTIPAETIRQLAEKTDAAVTVKTDVAQITMDAAAADAVAAQAEGDKLTVVAQKVKESADRIDFELKVVCSSGRIISDFSGGNVSITVSIPSGLAGKKLVAVYIDENGDMSRVEGTVSADGNTYTFTTGHFSVYALLTEEAYNAAVKEKIDAVENTKFRLTSKQVKMKNGKTAIRITWSGSGIEFEGVEIQRSTEKNKGYGKKPYYVSTKDSYYNTAVKKGTRYYYRARGYVTVDGEKVYTQWSTKAWRKVK